MAKKQQLTPELAAAIIRQVSESGLPVTYAAIAEGVSEATMTDWLTRGRREAAGPYRELVDGIRAAELACVERLLVPLRAAASRGDKGAARWLREQGISLETPMPPAPPPLPPAPSPAAPAEPPLKAKGKGKPKKK